MDEPRRPVEMDIATGASAVSWAAILGGVAATVATSLTLFALAAGLALAASGSLRANAAGSPAVLAAMALVVTQWLSALLGGYITGRLRTRWTGTHTHEVFFRDTAHGFITWCVATIFMASGVVAAASAVVGAPSRLGGPAAYGHPAVRINWDVPEGYGQLVLPDGPGSAAGRERRESALASTLAAAEPGTQEWGTRELRVAPGDPYNDERKDAAAGSLVTALSMVIGAFIACVSAVLGGRRRDLHP